MVFLLAFLLTLDSPMQTAETVVVRRAIVQARIKDPYNQPIRDLKPSDFEVIFAGRPAEVLSVNWIPESNEARAEAHLMAGQVAPAETSFGDDDSGRYFVFLFQRDIGRAYARVAGELGFLPYTEKIVDDLPKGDRVAVFSYDSRLRFRLDFTSDRKAIHDTLQHVFLRDEPTTPPAVPEPSLASRLDHKSMRRAATLEQGLLLLAKALSNIDGDVQVMVFGYGMGDRWSGGMALDPKWRLAKDLFNEAGIPVNTVNTSWRPGQLSRGLVVAAQETGGFAMFAKDFPQQSANQFTTGTLSGHHELELRPPADLPPGDYEVLLKIPKHGITMTVTVNLSE